MGSQWPTRHPLPRPLTAGASGTTTLGASATSATTSVNLPLLGSVEVLRINQAAGTWSTRIELVSASGFGVLDDANVRLLDGSSNLLQVSILLGSVVQTTGSPLTLSDMPSQLTIRTSGTVVGTGTFTLDLVMVPPDGGPETRYRYMLNVS